MCFKSTNVLTFITTFSVTTISQRASPFLFNFLCIDRNYESPSVMKYFKTHSYIGREKRSHCIFQFSEGESRLSYNVFCYVLLD